MKTCHIGTAHFKEAAHFLVALLVLGGTIAGALADSPPTSQFLATPERMWACGLNASASELSPADVSHVELLFKQVSEMASAEGQVMRAWGTGVGSEETFQHAAPGLLQAWTSALAIATYYEAGVKDPGAKAVLKNLLKAESSVCDTYRQLYSCVLAGDYDGANRNIASLNILKKEKGDLYANIVARMREVGGPAVDSFVIQGVKEAAAGLRTQ